MDLLRISTCLILSILLISTSQCKQPKTVSHVKYTLTHVKESILLSFKLTNVTYRFLGDINTQYQVQPEVYIINIQDGVYGAERFDEPTDDADQKKMCRSYFARSLDAKQIVASIDLCDKVLSGLVLTNSNYTELIHHNKTHIEIQSYPVPQLTKNMIKAVYKSRTDNSRTKRADEFDAETSVKGSVETAVFTEYRTYQAFCSDFSPDDPILCTEGTRTLNLYVYLAMKGADLFYKRIGNDQLLINLVVKYIYHNARRYDKDLLNDLSIFHSIELYNDGAYLVDSSKGLDIFSIYQEDYLRLVGNSTDHSLLFTTHEMIDEEIYVSGEDTEFRTIGIAYVDGVCDSSISTSMVQMVDRGLEVLFVIAHEIAHTLGAQHDGTYSVCNAEDNYLMSPWNQKVNLHNIFYFSCCSQVEMLRTIQKYGWCMDTYEAITNHDVYLAGVYIDRSVQCTIAFDESYRPCYNDEYANQDSLCTVNPCVTDGTSICELSKEHLILPGTDCGVDMWCIQGYCVDKSLPFDSSISPYQPKCDYAALNKDLELAQADDDQKVYIFKELFGRYASLFIGGCVFVAGILMSLFKRGKKQPGQTQNLSQNPPLTGDAVLNNQPMGGALPNQFDNYNADRFGDYGKNERHGLFT